jgi:hypothetical protein
MPFNRDMHGLDGVLGSSGSTCRSDAERSQSSDAEFEEFIDSFDNAASRCGVGCLLGGEDSSGIIISYGENYGEYGYDACALKRDEYPRVATTEGDVDRADFI